MSEIIIDRESLVDLLGVELKTETPEEREKSVRIGVDRKVAKLFGAKLFLERDWNIFSNPIYTLNDIQKRMDYYIRTKVSAEDITKVKLRVNKEYEDFYFFEKMLSPEGSELYRFSYCRQKRPMEIHRE